MGTLSGLFAPERVAVVGATDREGSVGRAILENLGAFDGDVVETDPDAMTPYFHGGDDAVVDPTDSFDAARRLESDVCLERFAGEGHRFSRAGERRLLDRLFGWLEWADR